MESPFMPVSCWKAESLIISYTLNQKRQITLLLYRPDNITMWLFQGRISTKTSLTCHVLRHCSDSQQCQSWQSDRLCTVETTEWDKVKAQESSYRKRLSRLTVRYCEYKTHKWVRCFCHMLTQYSKRNAFSLSQVVIGGINVDFIAKGKSKNVKVSWTKAVFIQIIIWVVSDNRSKVRMICCLFQFGQTGPGSVCQSFGGVGRNIAGVFSSDRVHVFACSLSVAVSLSLFLCRPSRLVEPTGPQTPVHLSHWGWLSQRRSV